MNDTITTMVELTNYYIEPCKNCRKENHFYTISFDSLPPHTVCTINFHGRNKTKWIKSGVALCSVDDAWNTKTGMEESFKKAIKDLPEKTQSHLVDLFTKAMKDL